MAHPTNFVPSQFKVNESSGTKNMKQQLSTKEGMLEVLRSMGTPLPSLTDEEHADLLQKFLSGYQKSAQLGEKTINKSIHKEVEKAKAEQPETSSQVTAFLMANLLETQQKLLDPNITVEEKQRLEGNKQFELFFLSHSTRADAARTAALEKAADTGLAKGMEKLVGKYERRLTQKCANPPCGKSPVTSDITLKKCARCEKVFYCSKPCQTAHWKSDHKVVCLAPPPAATSAASPTAADSVTLE